MSHSSDSGRFTPGFLPRVGIFFAASWFWLATAAHADPPQYIITDMGNLGGNYCQSVSINSSGQITGYSATNAGVRHAYRAPGSRSASSPGADLGTFSNPLTTESYGYAINDSGQVTGVSNGPATGSTHAFRTTATGVIDSASDLGTLGGTTSYGLGINASGQVTGYSGFAATPFDARAFRTSATGKISDPGTDLGTLGGTTSTGTAINDSGQVVGYSNLPGNTATHAFRTSATGKISDPGTDLGTLGGSVSSAKAINRSGQVAGNSVTANNLGHAFLTTATGKISDPGTDLGTLGGTTSNAYGLNNLGQVVGGSLTTNDQFSHGFIFTDGKMYDLNSLYPAIPGIVVTVAWSINDSGEIAASGLFGQEFRGFRLTPVVTSAPEPAAGLLVGAVCIFNVVCRAASMRIQVIRWRKA